MISVNIRALHILTKKIGQKLYKQGFGALLNVGSCAGLMPAGPYMATYYATKAYVVSLTSALARELKESHSPVYVGCLCPGPVNTEFNAVANVEFALRGITPEYCVRCALDGMARRRTVIVPGPLVAAGMTLGRFLPRPGLYQDCRPPAAEEAVQKVNSRNKAAAARIQAVAVLIGRNGEYLRFKFAAAVCFSSASSRRIPARA